jgi:hypothetical protein
MTVPLARDQHGNPLDLPPEAAFWRVRRHTGGRPSTVLGPDGEPLFLPVAGDRTELRAYGCNGSIRLEAVDSDYRPVHAPVAFVELGNADSDSVSRSADASPGHADMVRTSFEALTRTMEAMQRAQVERERALAQKERALTDAQVAMQRSHTELMIALLDRATGGKPQDPLTAIEQHYAIQKVMERGANKHLRNAGAIEVPMAAQADDVEPQGLAKWAGMIAPWVPQMGQAVASAVAGDNPVKAEAICRNASLLGGLMSGVASAMGGGQVMAPQTIPMMSMPMAAAAIPQPQRIVIEHAAEAATPRSADEDAAETEDDEDEDEDERPVPSKALRQVLAHLDDEEAETLSSYLDDLDEDAFEQIGQAAESISGIEERVAWARGLTDGRDADAEASEAEPAAQAHARTPATTAFATPMGIPAALLPVLAMLSPEEQMFGAQILRGVDLATLERLQTELLAVSPAKALAKVRRAITSAQQRAASIAQRAVMAAFEDVPENGLEAGGAS